MTETPDLQPTTNGRGASEYAMTRWSLIGFVALAALEMIVNGAMTYLTEQPYDAMSDTLFIGIGTLLVGGPLGYTTARTIKKGTLAKIAGGTSPEAMKGFVDMLVKVARKEPQ